MDIKKRLIQTAFATGAALGVSTFAANADCWIKEDGAGGYSNTRPFSGRSAKEIWPYCKKFIERAIASEGISSGTFGMRCFGGISCDIKGRIVNGRVVPDQLTLDGQSHVSAPAAPAPAATPAIKFKPAAVALPPVQPAKPVTKPAAKPTHDSGWAYFDALVEECSNWKGTGWFARTTEAQKPACKK